LLDWSFSPFVALHFATADFELFNRDGVVWCVDYVKAHALLPPKLCDVLKEQQADVFTTELLVQAAPTLDELDALPGEDDKHFVVFLDPPSLNDRIVNQSALLSLMSDVETDLDRWLQNHPHLYDRLIIPGELKWEIRDKLDQANVTERVLFPGLDGLSKWLRRYYSPREPNA